jgi:CCR4-NOT complex subunit CAF16
MSVGVETKPVAAVETTELSYRYGGGATIHTRALSDLKLDGVSLRIEKGSRVLIAGANGAGKSTFMSILGGQKMVPEPSATVLGKPVFHDTTLGVQRMYCGEWWRTNFFHNLSAEEVIGKDRVETPRVQKLVDILQMDLSWRVNAISDGQRRRVQLLDALAEEKEVYVLDEITTDLDLYAREELLKFLREETEERGATILYATHIFDQLADWATHMLFFAKGKLTRYCPMSELTEYQALCAEGARVPLYTLMKEWVFREYMDVDVVKPGEPWPERSGPVLELRNMDYAYAAGLPNVLHDCSFKIYRGQRVLLTGANGSCKSTVMSILGGKRLVPRGNGFVYDQDCFNDGSMMEIMYCGDWWRANYFMNMSIGELLGDAVVTSDRAKHLVQVLQVDLNWRVNCISDGQRRRCQLLELLSTPRPIYLMDEITSDLDLFSRDGVLAFLKAECEIHGATIVYCTHIYDHLEGWASHLMFLSKGRVTKHAPLDEIPEYNKLVADKDRTPLCSLIRDWVYAEYAHGTEKPWRKVNTSLDGRIPNLGLAGPMQAPTSS